jgi:hypothetical protein
VLISLVVTALASCGTGGVVFTDEGAIDGTTVAFHLQGRAYTVRWTATDREPWHGCDFSISLLRTDGSAGSEVGGSGTVRVSPRGRIDDGFQTAVSEGRYFFRFGGSCAWKVSIATL